MDSGALEVERAGEQPFSVYIFTRVERKTEDDERRTQGEMVWGGVMMYI